MRDTNTEKQIEKRQAPPVFAMLRTAVLVLVVFVVGVWFGQGRISLHSAGSPTNASLPNQLNYNSVNEVYSALKQHYDGTLTETQLLDGMKAGLANATNDPYTEYFTAKEAKAFDQQLNNSFSGIGAELGKDKDGNLLVIAPISGLPAAKAGLQSQDIITAIDKKDTTSLSVDEAVSKIRGKAGTKVVLNIVRGKSQQLTITITRQSITVPSVSYKVLDGNIGYIQILTFANDTSGLIKQAAQKLQAAGVKGVVLDLRNNPGGLLDAAVDVSSQWLPSGTTVLKEKRGATVVNSYESQGDSPLHGIPTVVLINQGSASASEITAGALHDNKAATVIGEKSYGKGVVQQLLNLKDGAELKVTVASWYRPNGQNINKKGITPDQTVTATATDIASGNDTQKTAAIDFLTKQ